MQLMMLPIFKSADSFLSHHHTPVTASRYSGPSLCWTRHK